MRHSIPALLLLSVAFCNHSKVSAFVRHAARRRTQTFSEQPQRKTANVLLRSSVAEDQLSSSSELSRREDVTKAAAISSLSKLMQRQAEELQETKRLLDRLNSTSLVANEEDKTSGALSAAASLITGFDYGFKSRSEGSPSSLLNGSSPAFVNYGPPQNIVALGMAQFIRNWDAIRGEYKDEQDLSLSPKQIELQAELEKLTLNSSAIWERELAPGPIEAPWLIKAPYLLLCYLLDEVFEGKYTPSRFFFLETVARMPYFSYIGMLHVYETFGFWRRSADIKRIHFAEELNEFRHLLIMESLGGDQQWWVRFMAQHSAVAYFLALCILWAISPSLSYRFSELLETHAVNTYGQFLDENEELLKKLPPSYAAVEYYSFGSSDPYYAEFQTSGEEIRRPGENMKSLYDVFSAIQADEGDHVKSMEACLDPSISLVSASLEKKILFGTALVAAGYLVLNGDAGLSGGLGDLQGVDLIGDALSAIGLSDIIDQLTSEGGDENELAVVVEDAVELGAVGVVVERVAQAVVGIGQALARFLPFL